MDEIHLNKAPKGAPNQKKSRTSDRRENLGFLRQSKMPNATFVCAGLGSYLAGPHVSVVSKDERYLDIEISTF